MIPRIEIDSYLEPLLLEAARKLDLEFEIHHLPPQLPRVDHISITAILGEKEQAVTYPTIKNSFRNNRLSSFFAKPNSDSKFKEYESMQAKTLEEIKKQRVSGTATARFNAAGEFINLTSGIDRGAIWSCEFAYTSIFENAVRAAYGLPLGSSELTDTDWVLCEFDASAELEMRHPYLHLFAHNPKYRIRKLGSHRGYVAISDEENLAEEVFHAVDYLEGLISE